MHMFKKVVSAIALLFMTATSVSAAEGTVVTDVLNIRSASNTNSTIISRVYNNQILNIVSKENSFYKIVLNGGYAYASADYVSINIKSAGVVTANVLNIRTLPSSDSAIAGALFAGEAISICGSSGEWYEIFYNNEIRYVHSNYVELRDASSLPSRDGNGFTRTGSRVVEYSKNYLGTPYVYGGETPSGFDCSGFTSYVYKQFGVSLPRSSASQASIGTPVSRANLLPGDLVFFDTYGGISHVGIYVGGDNFIHATVPGDVVRISSLNASYYSSRYVTARRILN